MQERESDSSCVDIQRMSLESAIRQAAEAIVITSATGKILFVNPAFTKMTGYRPDEVVGQFPSILKSGVQDPAFYADLWRTILAGQVWRGELTNRRKDGTVYTEELSITPVLTAGGRTSNYIAVKQDVTERRVAETARQFLAAILESTEDAVVGGTLDGKILAWGRAAEKRYGYRSDEARGQSILMRLAPEYHDPTGRVCEGLLRGRVYPQFESTAVRKNGERVEVRVSVCSVRNSAGQVTGTAAIIHDITKAKLAEKSLRDDEARFRMAFENAPFGLCMTKVDSRILQVNGTFCRMLGQFRGRVTQHAGQGLIDDGWP